MTRERVVLDTNVWISGLLFSTTPPARVVEQAMEHGQILASRDTLRELMRKLLAPKFDRYVSRERRDALLVSLAPIVEIVEIVQRVKASRDPKDDPFLEVAVNGSADVLVSGDEDLLVLDPFRGVRILTPASYLSSERQPSTAIRGAGGRRTYDIFAAHWPHVPADSEDAAIAEQFNRVAKYVATHRPESLDWNNSHGLGEDVVASLRDLKAQDGPDLLVQGSSELIQQLLAADLADEIHVLVFPLLLGKGKRLFGDHAMPAGLQLTQSTASPSGVVISRYERAGEVETGSFALEQPSEAEIERRRQHQG